jgi:hypothetical protein
MVPPNVDGLLVPVAVSASHVGYSTLRMEPHWTALGQAAGVAAAQAARDNIQVRAVDVPRLQERLHELGAMTIYIPDLGTPHRVPRPSWDPPGAFTVRRLDEPGKSPLFRVAQYFGTRGYFHVLTRGDDVRMPPRQPATGQWSEARMDLALEPDKPIDQILAQEWLRMAGIETTRELQADGKTTRGQFLQQSVPNAGSEPHNSQSAVQTGGIEQRFHSCRTTRSVKEAPFEIRPAVDMTPFV